MDHFPKKYAKFRFEEQKKVVIPDHHSHQFRVDSAQTENSHRPRKNSDLMLRYTEIIQ